MALLLLYQATFNVNDPTVTFLANDSLKIYVDTSLTLSDGSFAELKVYQNDVEIFTGPQLSQIYFSSESYEYAYHDSNIVSFVFGDVFPYGVYRLTPEATSVCDLVFPGFATVTDATGPTTADGQISVTATSTATIEYKLGQDFTYGSGQSSGTFTGLLPGEYRIYAVDSNGCRTSILVTVGYTYSWGTIYRSGYTSNQGTPGRIEIQELNYAGGVTEVLANESPILISLRGEGGRDIFTPIITTDADITLVSESNFQFIGLFTNQRYKYRILWQEDRGSGYTTYWSGFLIPSEYSEPYVSKTNYDVNLAATDGLKYLQNSLFLDDGGAEFSGIEKIIKVIALILKKTNHRLNIRVGVNMYASSMDTTNADDPFDQTYIDLERFYLTDKQVTFYDALLWILDSFGCRLIQADNTWTIIRVEELIDDVDYRVFDSDGDYVSNSTLSTIIDHKKDLSSGTYLTFTEGSQNMEIVQGFGKLLLNYDMGFNKVISNGDFKLKSEFINNRWVLTPNLDGFIIVGDGDTLQSTGYENTDNGIAIVISGASGNAYIESEAVTLSMNPTDKVNIKLRFKLPVTHPFLPYIKVRFQITYGTYYLKDTGEWTTTPNTIVYFATEFGKYIDYEVTAIQPGSDAVNGLDFAVKVFIPWAYQADYTNTTDIKNIVTTTLSEGYRIEYKSGSGPLYNMYYYNLKNTTDAESIPSIIRPNDYNASTNPYQWVRRADNILTYSEGSTLNEAQKVFYLDGVLVDYQIDGGNQPPESQAIFLSTGFGETYTKEIYFGSLNGLFDTSIVINAPDLNFSTVLGAISEGKLIIPTTSLQILSNTVASANLVYTGWVRDSNGDPYTVWTRDGKTESLKLQNVISNSIYYHNLKTLRKLTGTLHGNANFTFVNSIRETQDGDRIYIPVAGTINPKEDTIEVELIELYDFKLNLGYSSGFTIGFGQSGFD